MFTYLNTDALNHAVHIIDIIGYITAALEIIGLWGILRKTGEKPWKAVIPAYNGYLLYRISWRTSMFFLGLVSAAAAEIVLLAGVEEASDNQTMIMFLLGVLCLLLLCIFIGIIMHIKLGRSFGKSKAFIAGLVLLPSIFIIVLGWDKSQYFGGQNEAVPFSRKKKIITCSAVVLVVLFLIAAHSFVTRPGFSYKASPLADQIYSEIQQEGTYAYVKNDMQGSEIKSFVIKRSDGNKTIVNRDVKKGSDKGNRREGFYAALLMSADKNITEIDEHSASADQPQTQYMRDVYKKYNREYISSPKTIQQLIETESSIAGLGWD